MDRLHLMAVLVAVAEEESFAGGARRLAMSPPAVTRAVAMLEEHLGVKLLNRTTRYVRVTEAGQRYVEDARRIIAEADAADEAAMGINGTPCGHLAITAPVLFGKLYVLPVIVEFLQSYPGICVSAVFLDRVVNLLEEGLDIGVRIGVLPDSSMKALRVGSVRRVVCASPAYLAHHGCPKTPLELPAHTLISVGTAVEWKFGQDPEVLTVKTAPRLTVTTNDAAIAAAIQGFGITRLLSYQCAPYLAANELATLLNGYEPAAMPIHILHRESRHANAKVRAFIDLLAVRLRTTPALQ